jgi:lysophospholipase L1-like esterase
MRTSHRISGLAIAIVGILVLSPAISGAAPSSGSTVPAGAKYVALGSSYASGIGIPNQVSTTCLRSDHNYPHLLAAVLKLKLDDVSCAAATTANVLTVPQGSNPPQMDAVSRKTALVTFTVGGNDINYVATALNCGGYANCTVDQTQSKAALVRLQDSLTTMISSIRFRAPKAKLVLVTYPRLVPQNACPALTYTHRAAVLVGAMGKDLEQVFLRIARRTHVLLADPYALGQGHGPCAPVAKRWIAGHTVTVGFPYHPTPLGQVEMAKLALQALRRN